mmetsp:Transcript_40913/g.41787  ORF Transcript_40913/g.41787 Transcript_40913/m.41787 type:complete len:225 (+) Transcript_40913:103-777(+)
MEENCFEDEINSVSEKLVLSIKNANKGFLAINNSLLGSGKLDNNKLFFDKGIVCCKDSNHGAKILGKNQESSYLYNSSVREAPSLKKEKVVHTKTLGKGWFDLKPAEITEELKRDMRIIQVRNSLDPKRFYKNPDKLKNVLHTGTIIEGPSEYKSSRLSKKQRKQTLVEEVLADDKIQTYSKRKYNEIKQRKSSKKKTYNPFKKIKIDERGDRRREKLRKTLFS